MGISERRKYKATAPFTRTVSRPVVINGLRFVWVVALVWGELGVYFWSLSSCKWPEITSSTHGSKPTHVLLISDPQVRHPSELRGSWTKGLGQLLYELNLKRSWHVTRRLNPHQVFFLGDMLSSGKYVKSESEYKAYWHKFQSIFKSDPSLVQHYLPGNNDHGFQSFVSKERPSVLFQCRGPFQSTSRCPGSRIICIDAPGLVDEDYQRSASGAPYSQWQPIRNGPVEFVKSASTGGRRTILLSHIPLARPDTASCGPSREKGTIRRGVGHGYQNTLGKQATSFLLQTLRPAAVFSGDNRDFCEYSHPVEAPDREAAERAVPIREVTVKSFSVSNHIRRPGFQLLSLIDPTPMDHSFIDAPCLLPDPYRVYSALYTPLAFLTLLCLFVFNTYRSRRLRSIVVPPPMSLSPHSTPGVYTPLHPGPDVWSPYTPPVPVSPRSTLPPSLRAPNGLAVPTMRAASRPGTPLGSPVAGPAVFPARSSRASRRRGRGLAVPRAVCYPPQRACQ
ncbi:hypothetical protein FB45DRAFT_191286 [Roridomyces roridus]|uniref:Calcineurin-like phosphoesterase domain-containing protein n=1 Tax=Roridomyces roridus TaxID=1738132 RepID=A0AAD7FWH7_9AGAR|nr:hypothetical protein FB45DRAFT_191286 [Roridomyces roridus]